MIEASDRAEEIASSYIDKQMGSVADRMKAALSGELSLNRNDKRLLCNEMNSWIDFREQYPEALIHFRLDVNGNIGMYTPSDEDDKPHHDRGQDNSWGNVTK